MWLLDLPTQILLPLRPQRPEPSVLRREEAPGYLDQASDCEACSQRKTNDQWARSQGFGGGAYASTGSSAAGELPPPKTVFSCLSISFLFLFWNRA